MMRDLQKLLRPLATRVANLVSRAVLSRVDDSKQMQVLQLDVLAEETRDGVERVQNYGFTSVPLAGAEAVVLFVGGRREHGLAVAVDDRRYRVTGLQPGEVALYHKDGASVVLKADGSIEVTPKTGAVVKLAGSTDAALKGDTYTSAEDTFLTALSTYATGIKTVADPTNAFTPALLTAITTFKAALVTSKSTKVKLS